MVASKCFAGRQGFVAGGPFEILEATWCLSFPDVVVLELKFSRL